MIYSELQATVSATGACDLSASGDPVGPSYAAKTIGYSSRFLAYGTVSFPGPNCNEQVVEDGFHTIDFSQLYYTPIVTTTTYKSGCAPYANPRLSLPAELTNVDPAWKTCQPLFYGAFDPPSYLSKASRLAPAQADPATVTPTPPPDPALPAAAQATPAAQTPAATIAPNNSGQKAAAIDPPASKVEPDAAISLNGNKPVIVATPVASPVVSDPKSPDDGTEESDPSGQIIPSAGAYSPAPNPSPVTDPSSQKEAGNKEDPTVQVARPAAPVIVNPPAPSPASTANVVVAQGTTLTENGPPASIGGKAAVYSSGSVYVDSTPAAVPNSAPVSPAKAVVAQGQTLTEGGPAASVGGKAAVYSAGSIYLDSSTPVAVPKAGGNNVVVASGQTLTENGPTATIGGKAAVYSASSVYYDSTPIPIPNASPANVVVAQGQTLSENGPSAVIDGKTALYKAGSIYYDSTPVAVPSSSPGQQNPPHVIAAGVTFAKTVQTPSPVVTNGITFAPAVENASPVVAGGITFAPVSQPVPGNTREPVVAGGITFQPGRVQSPNAVALQTPAPLSVGDSPVLRAPDGGLIVAGSTIAQGSTASVQGHVIAANSGNVVVDGTTHSLAPATAYHVEAPTATPLELANRPVLKAANGDLVIAGSTISQGSTTSFLGHAISVGSDNVVLDGTTHAFGPITAHPLETPTPLEIANQPVLKAANGGVVIAGTTIPQGSQTSLFGHVISVGTSGGVIAVDGGKPLTFATAAQRSVTSLVFGSSDITTTLAPGATYSSDGHLATYTGSTPSALTEATSSVIGTTTVPLPPQQASSQIFIIDASPSPEPLLVEPLSSSSSSAVSYVLNGKTATAAAPSNVPLGGLILGGFNGGANGSNASSAVLPSIVLVNGTGTSTSTTARVGISPSSAGSEPGGKAAAAAASGSHRSTGSRVVGWSWGVGCQFVVFGYVFVVAFMVC